MIRSIARWSAASSSSIAGAMLSSTPRTACSVPLPQVALAAVAQLHRLERSGAAPLGTAARPCAPSSRSTSTSTVGLPRESRISRARTSSMRATVIAPGGSVGTDSRQPNGVRRGDPRLVGSRAVRRAARSRRGFARAAYRLRCGGVTRRTASRSACSGSTPAACASTTSASSREPRSSPGASDRRARALQPVDHLVGVQQGRQRRREAVDDAGPLLLGRLDPLPLLVDLVRLQRTAARFAIGSPNTCGLRRCSFAIRSAATSSMSNVAGLRRDRGVEVDLEQQVAELLAQVVPAAGAVAGVDRLQRLVRLLEQVAAQAAWVCSAFQGHSRRSRAMSRRARPAGSGCSTTGSVTRSAAAQLGRERGDEVRLRGRRTRRFA